MEAESGDHDSIIGYLEKKSAKLQLTNVPGAGIFVFDVPRSHQVFARPGRAAEASLKTELIHCNELIVTPTGHNGDIGAFSASLEYFFLEQSGSGHSPLAALTCFLQAFTSNENLLPQRAVAKIGGDMRCGRKHLQPWSSQCGLLDAVSNASVDACLGHSEAPRSFTGAHKMPSAMHALRSRAKCAQMRGRIVHKGAVQETHASKRRFKSRKTC